MAEKHWRQFLPKLVADLEASGRLHACLYWAERRTMEEMDLIRPQLEQLGHAPAAAHAIAWELIREHYILLPPEI